MEYIWSLLLYKESLVIRRIKQDHNHGATSSKEQIIFQSQYYPLLPKYRYISNSICNITPICNDGE